MILRASQGVKGVIVDLDTKQIVKNVVWLDLDTGKLEKYVVDSYGNHALKPDGSYQTALYQGRFSFTPSNAQSATNHSLSPRKVVLGADKCAKCPSRLTLPGDELCPACKAKDRNQRNRMVVDRLINPLLDVKCEKCGRLAVYSVSDEVEVSPERNGKRLYDRGVTVGRRYYCDFHYQPPRLLDSKGEIISNLEQERRPE